jgi:glutathione S-transferase
MPKNIVFCADGTWNGPDKDENGDGVPDVTNVLRLFSMLAGRDSSDSLIKQDEQEKLLADAGTEIQAAKYIHGVGDSRNPIKKLLGGVFGEGFIQRVVRGYTYISRQYQPDDRIFLVGFSRGAYTARTLAGMIARMGLIKPQAMQENGHHNPERAYSMGVDVWTRYREKLGKRSTLLGYLEQFKARPVSDADTVDVPRIAAVAVWDTVGALGVPIYRREDGELLDVFQFANLDLSSKVALGLHAVSIDEEREHFLPTLWNPRQDGSIQQVWFAGAHADVGGGYPERNLSDISLRWMMQELQCAGVHFDHTPDDIQNEAFVPGNTPWTKPPFDAFNHEPRKHPDYLLVHGSVVERMTRYPDLYTPASLGGFLVEGKLPPSMVAGRKPA